MMTTATQSVPASTVWLARLRFAVAIALVWAGLHFLAGGQLLPYGLDRPLVLVGSYHGPLAGLLVVVLLWAGAAVATLIIGPRDGRPVLIVLGLALALWAAQGGAQGGTIDQWLILTNEAPGPPTRAPYWVLLGDYLYLLIAVAGAYAVGTLLARRGRPAGVRKKALQRAFGLGPAGDKRGKGLAALLVTTVVAGIAVLVLAGPATAVTRRGQVYFAVLLGFVAGVYVASRVVKLRDPLWYWLAPFVLGIVGLLVAAASPGLMLPAAYEHLNSLPAWGLARALPIEMVGVGLVGTLSMLHGVTRRLAQDE